MKKLTPVILAVALALSVLGVLGTRIYQAAAYGGAAPEILFDSESSPYRPARMMRHCSPV